MKHRYIFQRFVSFIALQLLLFSAVQSQVFRPIYGWSDSVNVQLEAFLNSTITMQQRKVAVFDCDGTLFGQVPYYLADEALYGYARSHYAEKKDSLSLKKMRIISRLATEDNTSMQYVQDRIDFLSGMRTGEVERMGADCFSARYPRKFYPQMRTLLADLKSYGFEIWVVSASPEWLYQDFISKQLGIPENRIIGVRSIIHKDTVTGSVIYPVPQNEGKADAIETFIKARPLFAAGNSRGDMEMMNESAGLRMIVNPDDEKTERGAAAGDMNGCTVQQYWKNHGALIVHCADTTDTHVPFITGSYGIKKNKSTQ